MGNDCGPDNVDDHVTVNNYVTVQNEIGQVDVNQYDFSATNDVSVSLSTEDKFISPKKVIQLKRKRTTCDA